MRLAGAADQNQVLLMREEVAASEIPDECFVDRGFLEAELVDFLCQRQLCARHLVFDRTRQLLGDLGVQEIDDDLLPWNFKPSS